MASTTDKTTFPSYYDLPNVWQSPHHEIGGTFSSINSHKAGVRHDAELPVGEHELQLYSLATPNGQKVTILLEELGLEYDAWKINILKGEQFSSGFVDINPNSKIPALVDHRHEQPIRLFESGSILLYLAEREQKLIPRDLAKRTECINWLMWQMGTAPFIGGGFGHFYKYAPVIIEYAIDRYTMETKRILEVLDQHLENNEFIVEDEYTIADIAIMPWIRAIPNSYGAADFVQFFEYENVNRWLNTVLYRDAVTRGLKVNGSGPDDIRERHHHSDFDFPNKVKFPEKYR